MSLEIWIPPPGFGLKWYGLCRLCLSGMVFYGTMEVYECIYHFSSKWPRKKEKYANLKWILTNLFCCSSSLSKGDIIFLQGRSEKGCEQPYFLVWKRSEFRERGGTPPPRIPRITPQGFFSIKNIHMLDIQWLCNLRAVCWCRGKGMKVWKLSLQQSAGVVCCTLPIFKPSLGRRKKLPQKVAWRREIYASIPPPSLLEKGASSVLPGYFRLGGLPGLAFWVCFHTINLL